MKQEEYKLQKAVCQYLDLNNVLYCGSMGGQYQVHFSQRIKAKATGYKSGFPDLFIYEISKIEDTLYAGLAIELKTKQGRPTHNQIEWINKLQKKGYYACICKGLDEALETIDLYINNKI